MTARAVVPASGRLAAALVLVAWSLSAGSQDQERPGRELWTTLPPERTSEAPSPASLSELIEHARPAVVAIHTVISRSALEQENSLPGPFPFDPWRLFPEVPRHEREEGIGSGFIIREDGYLVTNAHVVENAREVNVTVEGLGSPLPARVIGADTRSDLALLKVQPPRALPLLPLGSSDDLPVGAWVVAIGNPFGLAHVATKGIVSGKGRTLGDLPRSKPGYFDFIQTDAAIDRGNSGGPLLDLRGQVVGINTAINSRARGISFAVPVDLAKAVLPHLWKSGRVVRSYLGITVDDVGWELAMSFGLDRPRGVLVSEVKAGGPAEEAGLARGDIILKFNGRSVAGSSDMGWRAGTIPAGQPVEVEVWRGGRPIALRMVPTTRGGEQPETAEPVPKPAPEEQPQLGLEVADLDPKILASCGLPSGTKGVVVVGAAGDATAHGVRVGDVISEVNGRPISSRADFDRELGAVARDKMVRFYLLRQKNAQYVALPKRW